VIDRIFSYLNIGTLCRCARVSKMWYELALDGSNWHSVDLFPLETRPINGEMEVNKERALLYT